jgi:hypothetical protein
MLALSFGVVCYVLGVMSADKAKDLYNKAKEQLNNLKNKYGK